MFTFLAQLDEFGKPIPIDDPRWQCDANIEFAKFQESWGWIGYAYLAIVAFFVCLFFLKGCILLSQGKSDEAYSSFGNALMAMIIGLTGPLVICWLLTRGGDSNGQS